MVSKILEGAVGGSMEFWAVEGLEPPQPPVDPPLEVVEYILYCQIMEEKYFFKIKILLNRIVGPTWVLHE
jgi:hypothetical protein